MTIAMAPTQTVMVIPYEPICDEIEKHLDEFVRQDDGLGRTFDYWAALESVCFHLGYSSESQLALNLIDGMIVDAVEDKYGVALPDSRLCGRGAA